MLDNKLNCFSLKKGKDSDFFTFADLLFVKSLEYWFKSEEISRMQCKTALEGMMD
ncbi:unnamed protein product [marine sediment metagenome]|uniref:Uncharacterized protein n=1 Tax=marine sediment metagenome TaxID=412755 RepID=X1E1B6_9ZZZZ